MTNALSSAQTPKPELPPHLKELARQLAEELRKVRGEDTKDDDAQLRRDPAPLRLRCHNIPYG